MKKITLLLFLAIGFGTAVMAIQPYKVCDQCHGLGYIRVPGTSNTYDCSKCENGRLPLSQRELNEIEREAGASIRMMEEFGLTLEEQLRVEELIKMSMTKLPIMVGCTQCDSTGKCKKCGGIVTITLDYDGCRYCGGTGRCPACNGGGYFQVGYRDNPNKAQIIKQIRDILYPNPPRPNPYPNPSPFPSPNPNPVDPDDPDPDDPDDDDPDDDDDDSSSRRGGIGAGYLVGGILGAGVLGWLGFRYFRR